MKNLIFVAALLTVGIGAYILGRMQGPPGANPTLASPGIMEANVAKETSSQAKVTDGRASPQIHAPANLPLARSMSAVERGFEAARQNLDDALKMVESLPVAERLGFITGVFSFVARHHSPAEALKIYQQAPEAQRPNALRALVAEWIDARSGLDEEKRQQMREGIFARNSSRLGLEVELTGMLASTKPDAELMGAWLDAFSGHSSRSEILGTLVGQFPRENPDAYLKRAQDWTPWEKELVARRLVWDWAREKPQEAWDWYRADPKRFDQDISSSLFNAWADSDPEGMKNVLGSLTDPGQRKSAIEVIGKTLAMKNTDAAVEWADAFADANERAAAQKAVYDGAPRGVGAVLASENGYTVVKGIVPGSPLEGTGVMAGDQLLEVQQPDGSRHAIYGHDLQTAINLIRGEPGSQMTLRVLRKNPKTGALEEHAIRVTRGQLYFNEKTLPRASE